MNTGLVKDSLYLQHLSGKFHPEGPARLQHIYSMLPSIDSEGITYIKARYASHEELSRIHDVSYIEFIARTKGTYASLDPDTGASPKTYEAALLAVGGCLSLADSIMSAETLNGFALIRPPGHHAEKSRSMGFCIFNNIAVAARYLQDTWGLERILVVDFDLHHGNGTQHSFYSDPTVLYFSTHQFPYYPGTGWYSETGTGAGKGYTVNVPMSYDMNDDDYVFAFQEVLVPIAHLYKPDMVLVSAGFDIYHSDPLGGMSVTEKGFSELTRIILDIAQRYCGSRALFALEGGYDPPGLARCVKAVVTMMKGCPEFYYEKKRDPCRGVVDLIKDVKKELSVYWASF
ncbi:MAG: histone deacetylase [Syntrophorhabdaceae bacterium]|nr:histone deacetylase [Syntrophorhabdaceae bacterium]MDD4195047.1 histone deacetylase [Syntrophorhabdaceae bacterium]